jgi:putative ABC transport system ATP-binding protein
MKKLVIGERIVKSYGTGEERRVVLDGVSVDIHEGEFVAVMGPSGSGKSTLLHALSGMDTIDEGKVIFGGRELTSASEKELAEIRRTQMGFVFQQPTMLRNLNLLDNIILPALRDHRKHATDLVARARMLMKRAGISELEQRDITQVSGGQLQRAGICRALMNRPRIVFGDEPTGALNSRASQEIMSLFAEVNAEGTAVMLVTHDARVAAWAERVLFMRDGRIVSELALSRRDGTGMEARVEQVARKMIELNV